MSIPDIRVLLNLQGQPTNGCQAVNDLLDHHIDLVQVQTRKLQHAYGHIRLRSLSLRMHSNTRCGVNAASYDSLSSAKLARCISWSIWRYLTNRTIANP